MDERKANKESDYKIESVNIRIVENGYVVRCEKTLTEKAKAKQRMKENKRLKGGSEPVGSMEHYKSEEKVADSLKEVKEIIEAILTETDKESEFNEAFDDGEEE